MRPIRSWPTRSRRPRRRESPPASWRTGSAPSAASSCSRLSASSRACSASPPPQTAQDAMVITDFDPREGRADPAAAVDGRGNADRQRGDGEPGPRRRQWHRPPGARFRRGRQGLRLRPAQPGFPDRHGAAGDGRRHAADPRQPGQFQLHDRRCRRLRRVLEPGLPDDQPTARGRRLSAAERRPAVRAAACSSTVRSGER